MSACHRLRLHSPLKTVLNKLGDSYHTYCNTYKTHTMATHHGGTAQPLDRDIHSHGTNTNVDIQDNSHHKDTGDLQSIGQEHDTNMANLTWELDDLCHKVQAGEGQPVEALHCIEEEI